MSPSQCWYRASNCWNQSISCWDKTKRKMCKKNWQEGPLLTAHCHPEPGATPAGDQRNTKSWGLAFFNAVKNILTYTVKAEDTDSNQMSEELDKLKGVCVQSSLLPDGHIDNFCRSRNKGIGNRSVHCSNWGTMSRLGVTVFISLFYTLCRRWPSSSSSRKSDCRRKLTSR